MSTQLFFKKVSVFVVGTFMLSSSGAHAVNSLWTGDTSSDMTDVLNNWDLPAYPTLSTGTFTGDAATITNPVLNSYFYADTLNFQSAGWVLGGTGTLVLQGNGWGINATALTSGTISIMHGLEVRGSAQQWAVAGQDAYTSVLNIYGNVSGTGNLTLNARGGQLNLYGDNTAFTGTLTLATYANIGLGSAKALGSGTINMQGASLLNLTSSPLTITNDFVLNSGWNVGRVNALPGQPDNNTTLILTGNLFANTVNNNQLSVQSGTLIIAGSISGTGLFGRGTYNQNGSLVLAGDNRGFSGTMNFSPGGPSTTTVGPATATYFNNIYAAGNSQLMLFQSAAILGNSSGAPLKLATSSTLKFYYNPQFVGPYDLDMGDGDVEFTGNTNMTVWNNYTLTLGTLLTTNYQLNKYGSGNLIFSGSAAVGTGKEMIIKEGLLAVKGTLTNSGQIRIDNGQLGANGTLTETNYFSGQSGTAVGFAAFGGDLTLNFGGSGSSYNWGNSNTAFMGGGNKTLLLGHALADGTVDLQNGVLLNNNVIHTVEAVSGSDAARIDGRFSGTISGGNATTVLRKTGGGVLELAGNNTYSGTTAVTAGTLLVSGTTSGQGAFTVSANATLGGHGVIGTNNQNVNVSGVLDVSGGGVLDDIGTLTLNLGTGTLDLSAAQGLGFILGADGDNDQIKLLGNTKFLWNNTLTLDDFNFTLGSGFTGDGTYELIVSDGTLLPSFTDLTGTLGGGAYDATLSLLNNSALVLTVTAIPEPSALALLLGGAALLLVLRRRR